MNAAASKVPLGEVADLIAPGRLLPFRVLDAQGRLLLATGHVIHDARQLVALLERGACVEYDEVAAVRKARQGGAGGGASLASTRHKTWFDRFEEQVPALDGLLRMLGRDAGLAPQLEAFADGFVALVERQPDAAVFLAVRQDDKRVTQYPLTHALHTASVVLVTARQLQWPAHKTACVVRAALTMNASVVELQARMAEQRDPPTKKQLDQLRAHPAASAQLLRDSGVTDADWLATVEDHHERPGGGGYPRGLVEVTDLVHVLRAADVYAAKISPRALRPALAPQVAARQLFQEEQGGPVAAALIRAVGIYPPGDIVKLKNGETAVVVQRAGPGTAVQVAVLLSAQGKPVVGAPRRDTGQGDFAIASAVPERGGRLRVLPEVVFGLLEAPPGPATP